MIARKLLAYLAPALLVFGLTFTSCSSAGAQGQTGGQTGGNGSNTITSDDSDPGTAWTIRQNYFKRFPWAKAFGPSAAGGSDQVSNGQSQGPGSVTPNSGPIYQWPATVSSGSASSVPTQRDSAITKYSVKTFGYPVSDTQFQIIQRLDDNMMLEEAFDPERWMWLDNAIGAIKATSAANSMANLERNQAVGAIGFVQSFLANFTTDGTNVWNRIRDQLFVPMAVLLLLPGAVLTQVRAIVAQGSPIFGEVNPFEGIFRAIVAVFLIPATYLIVNYGIDVANSISYEIAQGYQNVVGGNMYQDASAGQQRAFPIHPAGSDLNQIPPAPTSSSNQSTTATNGTDPWSQLESISFNVTSQPDETAPVLKSTQRAVVNGMNGGLAATWNVLCAFQMAYLYYLFCIGPIVAALWVWPTQQLRNAFPSWVEGVVTICFWSLFWNTTVLLMACFKNTGDTGTVIMSALNFLSISCVKNAFDFAGLVKSAGDQVGQQLQQHGKQGGAGAHGPSKANHNNSHGNRHGLGVHPAHPAAANHGTASGVTQHAGSMAQSPAALHANSAALAGGLNHDGSSAPSGRGHSSLIDKGTHSSSLTAPPPLSKGSELGQPGHENEKAGMPVLDRSHALASQSGDGHGLAAPPPSGAGAGDETHSSAATATGTGTNGSGSHNPTSESAATNSANQGLTHPSAALDPHTAAQGNNSFDVPPPPLTGTYNSIHDPSAAGGSATTLAPGTIGGTTGQSEPSGGLHSPFAHGTDGISTASASSPAPFEAGAGTHQLSAVGPDHTVNPPPLSGLPVDSGLPAHGAAGHALSQPGGADHLAAAVHGDTYGQQAYGMGTHAGADAHAVAAHLGVADATVSGAAHDPISAAQFHGAESQYAPQFAHETAQALNTSPDMLSAAHNPIAAAPMLSSEAHSQPELAHSRAFDSHVRAEMGNNPLMNAQLVGAEGHADPQFAQGVAASLGPDTGMQAASNPILAAQMMSAEGQPIPTYAQAAAHDLGVSPQAIAPAATSPIMAAEAQANPQFAQFVAGQMQAQPELIASMASDTVVAAQPIAYESQPNPNYYGGYTAQGPEAVASAFSVAPGYQLVDAAAQTYSSASSVAEAAVPYPIGGYTSTPAEPTYTPTNDYGQYANAGYGNAASSYSGATYAGGDSYTPAGSAYPSSDFVAASPEPNTQAYLGSAGSPNTDYTPGAAVDQYAAQSQNYEQPAHYHHHAGAYAAAESIYDANAHAAQVVSASLAQETNAYVAAAQTQGNPLPVQESYAPQSDYAAHSSPPTSFAPAPDMVSYAGVSDTSYVYQADSYNAPSSGSGAANAPGYAVQNAQGEYGINDVFNAAAFAVFSAEHVKASTSPAIHADHSNIDVHNDHGAFYVDSGLAPPASSSAAKHSGEGGQSNSKLMSVLGRAASPKSNSGAPSAAASGAASSDVGARRSTTQSLLDQLSGVSRGQSRNRERTKELDQQLAELRQVAEQNNWA